jgi:GNAT superfamily N-acetyltransferase
VTLDGMSGTLSETALRWANQSRTVPLRAGGDVELRGARSTDADAVAAMHLRCTSDSIYGRYFTLLPQVSRRWQQALLDTEVALVAAKGRLVLGLGNLTSGPSRPAELGILVEDAAQGQGIGTALARQLAATARLLGHRSLRGETLPDAALAQRMVGRLGPSVVRRSRSTVVLDVRLGIESLVGLGDPVQAIGRRAV